jgi:hypothetical protein
VRPTAGAEAKYSGANTNGAQATFKFYGNGVQLYGATSSNHGPYTVALDGGAPAQYNGTQFKFRPQQLLVRRNTGARVCLLTRRTVLGLRSTLGYARGRGH